jgi:hypothetical protein
MMRREKPGYADQAVPVSPHVEDAIETEFFPKNASGAFISLFASIVSLSQRVGQVQAAGGITQVGTVLQELFTVGRRPFRIDIENLRGHNLRF